jgi:hypothetical protein
VQDALSWKLLCLFNGAKERVDLINSFNQNGRVFHGVWRRHIHRSTYIPLVLKPSWWVTASFPYIHRCCIIRWALQYFISLSFLLAFLVISCVFVVHSQPYRRQPRWKMTKTKDDRNDAKGATKATKMMRTNTASILLFHSGAFCHYNLSVQGPPLSERPFWLGQNFPSIYRCTRVTTGTPVEPWCGHGRSSRG